MVLNTQQEEAIQAIKTFINSDEHVFSLTGYAGTGKTTLIRSLIKDFSYSQCVLLAPTNKAAIVLSAKTGWDVHTIHSFLELKPSIEVSEIDINNLEYVFSRSKSLKYYKFMIIDEASMINDDFYDYFVNHFKDSKIIFVGDLAQLKPVKQNTKSKCLSSHNCYNLTQVMRTEKDDIVEESMYIRNNGDFSNTLSDNVQFHMGWQSLFENHIMPAFINNRIETKVICGLNKNVDKLNNLIRKTLYEGVDDLYVPGDIVTACTKVDRFFFTSSSYFVESATKVNENKEYSNLNGYRVTLKDDFGKTQSYFIIDGSSNTKEALASLGNEVNRLLRKAKLENKWKPYFDFVNSFLINFDLQSDGYTVMKKSIDYGYAITAHKAQGSTYDTVFVVNDFRHFQDKEIITQLKYVSVTRASNKVHIYQGE